MSIYVPQHTEAETTAIPNCLCGDKGRARNERECVRRGGCRGCGFDREEYIRRLKILHDKGMKPITTARRADLLHEWGMNPNSEISGLRIGKKKAKKEGTG